MKPIKMSIQRPEHGPLMAVNDWAQIKNWLHFVKPGRWVKIAFSVVYHIRSTDQNAWYWVNCTRFAVDFGWDGPDEVHEYFKGLFLKKKYTLPNGTLCETIGSTKELNTVEFAEYVKQCRVHAYHKCDFAWEDPKRT